MTDRIINTTGKDDWATPPWVIAYVLRHLDAQRFDLDAAAQKATAVAPRYMGPDHRDPRFRDALEADWFEAAGGGRVWFSADGRGPLIWDNNPYSKAAGGLDRWCMANAAAALRGATVAGLFFARTETAAWHDWVSRAAEVHFIRARLKFIDPATSKPRQGWDKKAEKWRDQPAPAPSVIAIWTPPTGVRRGLRGLPRTIHVPKSARIEPTPEEIARWTS